MIGFKKQGLNKVYVPMGKPKVPKNMTHTSLGKYVKARSRAILDDENSYHVDGQQGFSQNESSLNAT